MQQTKYEVRHLNVFEGKLILCRETSIPMHALLTKIIFHNSKTLFISKWQSIWKSIMQSARVDGTVSIEYFPTVSNIWPNVAAGENISIFN